MKRLVLSLLAGLQLWVAASTGYLLVLLAGAARRPPAPPAPRGEPLATVVLVPAHDEVAGIAATVRALAAQDFPAGRSEVIVIADNCADATAEHAGAAGATVWEREHVERGKGQALAWALESLPAARPATEAVVIVDADCLASPSLLTALDTELRRGARAAQAAYDVANADASSTSALRWAGFALMHRVRPRGRRALGLSADLFGSGMAFRTELLREHPWRSFSITEDAEYHLQLARAGVRVAFTDAGRVESPMPTTAAAAHDQQLRWESGNAGLARRSAASLAVAGLRRRDPNLIHAGLEQLVPPQSLLAAASGLSLGAALLLRSRALGAAAGATVAGQALYVLGGLRVAGAPPAVYRALAHAPSLATRKLTILGRVGSGRGATDWVRTQREPVPVGGP